MRRLLRALIVGLGVTGVVAFMLSRRRAWKSPAGVAPTAERGAPLRALRDIVVHSFNPLIVRYGLAGGAHSPWGLIEHTGRTTGHLYRSPVAPRAIEGGFEIPLPYGADVHWVKNVEEAGQTRLQFRDTIYELEGPEVVAAVDARSISPAARRVLQGMGYRYLRLRTVASMPGAFSHLEGHAAAVTHGGPVPMEPEGPFAGIVPPEGSGVEVPAEPKMVEREAEPELAGAD